VDDAERDMLRSLIAWKRAWDQTGFPGVGVCTYTTNSDRELYEAVQRYERAAADAVLDGRKR
jgi:hypothetical protein